MIVKKLVCDGKDTLQNAKGFLSLRTTSLGESPRLLTLVLLLFRLWEDLWPKWSFLAFVPTMQSSNSSLQESN